MSDVTVMEYQMSYPLLTNKLQKENITRYRTLLYNAKVIEARRGMMARRINKANSKGTKITYKNATKEEFNTYCEQLNEEYKEMGSEKTKHRRTNDGEINRKGK